jgi:hypothetical protein
VLGSSPLRKAQHNKRALNGKPAAAIRKSLRCQPKEKENNDSGAGVFPQHETAAQHENASPKPTNK